MRFTVQYQIHSSISSLLLSIKFTVQIYSSVKFNIKALQNLTILRLHIQQFQDEKSGVNTQTLSPIVKVITKSENKAAQKKKSQFVTKLPMANLGFEVAGCFFFFLNFLCVFFLLFTTVLSPWDFSPEKFRLLTPGKASCDRVLLPPLQCTLGVLVFL